jgi:hypothetical protein
MASKTYETFIKIGASISKAFKSDTLGAASALGKLTDAQKRLKAAEAAAKSVSRLGSEVGRAKARYDQAAVSLRHLEAAERAAGGATKESTKWRAAGTKEVAKAAKELDRATKAAEKNARAMGDLGKLRFQASRERIFGAGSDKPQTPLVQKAGEQLRGIGSDVLRLGVAALGAGGAMAGLAMKSLKAGDELGDTSDKLGISAKALQELRYGAQQSGAETGELDKSLRKMLVTVGKFKNAKGKAKGDSSLVLGGVQMLGTGGGEGGAGGDQDPFKRLGLNAKTLANLKPDEQLKKIADGMAKLKTHADKAAVAQAIFGKGATDLLPFLEEGSAGIDKLSAAANKFGGVLSDDAIKAADEADRALKDAELAVSGLTATLGAELLPVATKVFKEFSAWVARNRGQIQQWAQTAAKWIEGKGIPALMKIGAEVKAFAIKAASLIDLAARMTGGFDRLSVIVASLRFAPLAVTLSKIGVEGFKAAAALVRYAAAAQAAKAAEGGPGIGAGGGPAAAGKAMGLAANAAMVIGAAAIGYEIGKALDGYFGLSDKLSGWIGKVTGQKEKLSEIEQLGADTQGYKNQARATQIQSLTEDFQRQGMSRGQALHAAEQQIVYGNNVVRTDRNGGTLHFAPQISVGGESRGEVAKNIDRANAKAKALALEAVDRRAAHRRRVSFSEVTP